MSTASDHLTIQGISVDIVFKEIKNLHIGVYPPLGRVRVAAPTRLGREDVRLAVVKRLPWIKKQRSQLQAAQRQSEREMVTGESHFVWGVRHRLRVVEHPGRGRIERKGASLTLYARPELSAERRRAVLDRWYRAQLTAAIPPLIEKWERVLGVDVQDWSLRRMKTKWGTCSRDRAELYFNVELAKKHPDCLEYVVVHEMTHLLERNHTSRFVTLMDDFLPDWRARQEQLNEAPLAHEEWPLR